MLLLLIVLAVVAAIAFAYRKTYVIPYEDRDITDFIDSLD